MTPSSIKVRFFSPDVRTALSIVLPTAALLGVCLGASAQAAGSAPDAAAPAGSSPAAAAQASTTAAAGQAQPSIAPSNPKPGKTRKQKEEKVVESKDTKKEDKKTKKVDPLEGVDAKLPDKELYDKAEDAAKHGRYDVARLDLQTLLNTYPDSQFMMRAKLAIADSWYKEGGLAALTQAEQEYKDFITFFPNAPEAAEAQMRVGDIYFRQMDKPDRDYSKTLQAEQEYRLMLQQFPDSPLVPQAKQRLREVQETLASREADIAAFYVTRGNWTATIARYQTVIDTYPLYSQLDDTLIGLGDAYEAQARFFRAAKALPGASKAQQEQLEAGKERLVNLYEREAAAAYDKVVLEHSAAPHVEDARDRLAAMGLPIPTPTPEQVAASVALENSRGQYTLSKRAVGFFLHQADTVPAATIGDPPLEDAKATLAPAVAARLTSNYVVSMSPPANAPQVAAPPTPASAPAVAAESAPAPAPAPVASAPLAFQDVPTATPGSSSGSSAVVTSVPEISPAASLGGSAMGIEIVQPSSGSPVPTSTAFPGTATPTPATATPTSDPAQPSDANGGLKPVGPPNATPLAPIEKAATAPDAINDVTPGSQPPAQTAAVAGKKPKPAFDKADESSSKHKKKKGLAKLNPF